MYALQILGLSQFIWLSGKLFDSLIVLVWCYQLIMASIIFIIPFAKLNSDK